MGLEQRIAWIRRREEREGKTLYPAELCLWECRVVVGKYSKWITLGTTASQTQHPQTASPGFITASQLHHPGYHGNLPPSHCTSWQRPPAHTTLPKPLISLPCFPKGPSQPIWGREDSRDGPGQQMPGSPSRCLFSLCLTAALWILLLPRLWTVGPAQETQPNIYLPLFDLKQPRKGCKSVHQHPANPTFPPARESQH